MMLLVVSGASRGFGQAVAEAFARHPSCRNAPMRVLLTARSETGLLETKRRMLECNKDDGPTGSGIEMNVSIHPMDLGGGGDIDTLDNQLTELIDSAQPLDRYDRIVIVNNAGSLGHLGKIADMTSLHDFSQTIHLNITTSLWFTTRWTRALLSNRHATATPTTTASESTATTAAVIVNVSSLCALEPFATMTTYCAGKAARDMFHQSLAKEEEHTIRVLNYAPGAMDTDMTVLLREEGNQLDHGLKDFFRGAHEKGELIDPMASAAKLVQLVCSGDFVSGSHVDYWDLPDNVAS